MRLKDYVEQAEKNQIFGYDDLFVIKQYIMEENRFNDFSQVYIDMLTEIEEEEHYLDSARKEIVGSISMCNMNHNDKYTEDENKLLVKLTLDYAMYGDFRSVLLDDLRERISTMELPSWCFQDVLKWLVEKYNINFKTPYTPERDYFLGRFRKIMDKRIQLEKEKREKLGYTLDD